MRTFLLSYVVFLLFFVLGCIRCQRTAEELDD